MEKREPRSCVSFEVALHDAPFGATRLGIKLAEAVGDPGTVERLSFFKSYNNRLM